MAVKACYLLLALICITTAGTGWAADLRPGPSDFAPAREESVQGLKIAWHPLSFFANNLNFSAEYPIAQKWTGTANVFFIRQAFSLNPLEGLFDRRPSEGTGGEVNGRYYWQGKAQSGFYVAPGVRYVYFSEIRQYSDFEAMGYVTGATSLSNVHALDATVKVGHQFRLRRRFTVDLAGGTSVRAMVSAVSADKAVRRTFGSLLFYGTFGLGVVI